MDQHKPMAFMSYAHKDDDLTEGYLTKFCEILSKEVNLLLDDEEFCIFQDTKDIKWGQSCESRIENSLDNTILLIPIVTPGFFKSSYCCKELKRFRERERKLKRDDLILPIYFVNSDLLEDKFLHTNNDIAQIIAAHQYVDWRALRRKIIESEEVHEAIEALAAQIFDRINNVRTDLKESIVINKSFESDRVANRSEEFWAMKTRITRNPVNIY